ncbi:MAG: DUF2934 domain-containing protein [Sulfuricaulis sp.]|nr:DUF2934 domain-containing protein [Sulfuricaulis sp.]
MANTGISRKNPGSAAAGTTRNSQSISSEERQQMIAEAAYFRAIQRGFNGGNSIDDWLAAEREINRLLPSPQQQKQERAAYDKLRAGVSKVLAEARETINGDTIREALDRSVAQLKQLGEYTGDTVDKVKTTVEKDMAVAAQKIGPHWDAFSEKTADLFQVWRDRGQQFLAGAAQATADWLREASGRLNQHTYRTGEMTASGALECTGCGERLVLKTPAHLPPCPKCRKTEFKRI